MPGLCADGASERAWSQCASVAGGALLTHGTQALPIGRPALIVSLARSGDSPESVGALALMLKTEPELRHLVLTATRKGSLANRFPGRSKGRHNHAR